MGFPQEAWASIVEPSCGAHSHRKIEGLEVEDFLWSKFPQEVEARKHGASCEKGPTQEVEPGTKGTPWEASQRRFPTGSGDSTMREFPQEVESGAIEAFSMG